jgi:hypothetical protein
VQWHFHTGLWGEEDTHGKPTIHRILKGTFAALAELGMTLAEADLLFAHRDTLGVRELMIARLTERYALKVFSDLDELAKVDRTGMRFRDEVVGPLNRLAEFYQRAGDPAHHRPATEHDWSAPRARPGSYHSCEFERRECGE